MKINDGAGFTLIEGIMVIVIIGILAAASIPAITSSYDRLKMESAYRQLKQDVRYARQLATTRQVNHGILFNPATETYSVYRQAVLNIVKDPSTQKSLTVTYASGKFSGINLVSTTFTNPAQDRLEFNSLGAPLGAGIVTVSYGGVTKTVQVEANTGRII